jgi:hypothetical protein
MNTPMSHDRENWLRVAKERDEIKAERDAARAEVATEKNLHAQTRTVVEELNTICTDLRNAGGPPFIRSEAIRLLREDQATLRAGVERLNDQLAKAVWDTDVNRANARADKAEAELAAERARLDDLVADLNDACITLASAKNDCDDYAMQNTGFKLEAVRDVLLQYIPNAAMKEGAK